MAAGMRPWLFGVLLLCAAFAAEKLRPTQALATQRPPLDLEAAIPVQFDGWRATEGAAPVLAQTAGRAQPDEVYDQTLARTYVNAKRERVMLVIAYGADQSNDRLQAHRPEYCYRAQGFAIRAMRDASLHLESESLPVRRLMAERAARSEPVTYWLVVGDRPVLPGVRRKLAQLGFGLAGTVPDGLLVRVSSLDRDADAGHALQDEFIRALLASLAAPARARLVGSAT